jgi:hypothetical protein
MLPLPDPIAGGSLEALWQYINVPDDAWPLLAVLIAGRADTTLDEQAMRLAPFLAYV